MVKTAQTYIYPKFWQATNLIVIYIFIQTLIDFPLALYDYHHDTNWLYEPWIKIPVFVGSTLFILFLGYYYSGLTVKEVFPLKRFRIGLVPALLAALIPLQFFLTEISIQFDKVLPPPRWFMELFARLFDSDFGVWSGVLRVVIIAPVVEELIFRGVLQRIFTEWTKNIHWGILIAAILFSGMHMQFYGFVPRLILGVLFGYLFYWSRSIWVPITAHFVNNTAAVLVYYFYPDSKSEEIENFGATEGTYVFLFVSAIIVGYLLWRFYKEEKKITGEVSGYDY